MPRARVKLSAADLASELGALESDLDRRRFLARNKSLLRSEVVKRLAPLVVDKIGADIGLAMRLAEGTLVIARKLRRKEDVALAMRAKANALYASGDNHGAVEHHEQACKLYES